MSNFEKMKENIKDFIDNMDKEEFYYFVGLITDVGEYKIPGVMTCDECKEKYGDCEDTRFLEENKENDYCKECFLKYANEEE